MGSYDVTRGVFALSRFLGGVSFQLAARLRLEDDIVFDLPERLFVRAEIPLVREEWGLGSEDLCEFFPTLLGVEEVEHFDSRLGLGGKGVAGGADDLVRDTGTGCRRSCGSRWPRGR